MRRIIADLIEEDTRRAVCGRPSSVRVDVRLDIRDGLVAVVCPNVSDDGAAGPSVLKLRNTCCVVWVEVGDRHGTAVGVDDGVDWDAWVRLDPAGPSATALGSKLAPMHLLSDYGIVVRAVRRIAVGIVATEVRREEYA